MDSSQSQPLTITQGTVAKDNKKSSVNIWLIIALVVAVVLMLLFFYLYVSNKAKSNKGKSSKTQKGK